MIANCGHPEEENFPQTDSTAGKGSETEIGKNRHA
jgi:hypothetical protein